MVLTPACIVPGQYGQVGATGSSESGPSIGGGSSDGGGTTGTNEDAASKFDLGGSASTDDMNDDPPRPPPLPPNDGDCCEVGEGSGCADPAISACVCAVDPRCCTDAWDELCVDHIELLECGGCTVGPAGIDVADCCAVHEEPSCADDAIAQCVCATDPYCCDIAWDQVCVDRIAEYGCGECAGPRAPADCCTPGDVGGCPDPEISACVCEHDPYCCDTQWDELCVDEASSYCGGCLGDADATTGDLAEPGDCCAVGMGPGCEDPGVTMCVCAQDAYCCDQLWDAVCVSEVDLLGCGVCDAMGTTGNATNDAMSSSSSGSSGGY